MRRPELAFTLVVLAWLAVVAVTISVTSLSP